MNYYEVAILGSNLKTLTYQSELEIENLTLVKVNVQAKPKTGCVILKCKKPAFKTLNIEEILDKKYFPYQEKLANFISEYYVCEISQALNLFLPYSKITTEKSTFSKTPTLSQTQENALNFIKSNKLSLLFGDTGSGKTEIYIKLINEVLNQNKQALFLMPEISLTPQIQQRLEKYFSSNIAIWHSKITAKAKEQTLENLQNGKVKLIAGARSALFLPFCNLGLIIIDEEHDDSYKSSQTPRYNARDTAIMLGKFLDIKVILGSATPKLQSYEKIPHFRLKGKFFQSKTKFIYENAINELSQNIISEISNSLKQNKQAIIFMPTRGNYKYIICQECGFNIECPYCSVSMSLHKDRNLLKCHYCNFAQILPKICPKCSSTFMEARRIGTSEVVDELRAIFPDKIIEKFDRDTIKTQKQLEKLLYKFNKQEINILVGTQMLSKGHDYHKVDLSVILGLDFMLYANDFRAREKAVSLAIQISGRSGRKDDGKVLLQSVNSDFFKNYMQDYEIFLKEEQKYRQNYPPNKKLLRILISHKNEKKCQELTSICLAKISNLENLEILTNGKANIEKISNNFRYHILLRSKNIKPLLKAGHLCKMPNVIIDTDPIDIN